jgi:hypothetical protein
MRDEFSAAVKETLARRVGHRCSNPACRQLTSGPTSDAGGVINVGVAAHITAAATGGPRYDAALSVSARKSSDNGIWLCQKCAKLVDSDLFRYSSEILRLWRQLAEQVALAELESRPGAVAPLGFAAGEQLAATPRPWVTIDGYSAGLFEDEETGEEDLRERVRIVNRGEAPAVSIVIPKIRFARRSARLQSPLPTLGPGEAIDAEISSLRTTLDRVYRKMPDPPKGPKTLRFPWIIEYRGLDHNRWTTEHEIFFDGWNIRISIVHPSEPQQWTNLSFLEQ